MRPQHAVKSLVGAHMRMGTHNPLWGLAICSHALMAPYDLLTGPYGVLRFAHMYGVLRFAHCPLWGLTICSHALMGPYDLPRCPNGDLRFTHMS